MSVSGEWLESEAGEDGFGAKVWKGCKNSLITPFPKITLRFKE